jgi:hypothetical protein
MARTIELVLPGTASGVFRPAGDPVAAQQAIILVETFPGMTSVALTEQRARIAAQIVIAGRDSRSW